MGFLDRFLGPREERERGDYYGDLYDELIHYHKSRGLSEEEARKQAIGGDYDTFGKIERDLLLTLGYTGTESLVDLGCGSGRLACKLAPLVRETGSYTGLDVNETLLDEARKQVRKTGTKAVFRFEKITDPVLPCGDREIDFIVAFSVVTHIDVEDAYNYFVEMARVLKPGGTAVVSYLSTEIEGHWEIFCREAAMSAEERNRRVRNHVMVPGTLNRFAEKAGLRVLEDHPADEPWIALSEDVEMDGKPREKREKVHLGQSCLILQPSS